MAVMNWRYLRRWVYMGFTWAYVGLPHESDVHIFETGRLIYVISRVAAWGPWTLETLEAAIPELLLPNSWLLQRSRPSSACSSWNCAGTTLATDHERVEGMISVGKFIWSYWYILFLWAETNVKLCEVGNSKVSDSQKKIYDIKMTYTVFCSCACMMYTYPYWVTDKIVVTNLVLLRLGLAHYR